MAMPPQLAAAKERSMAKERAKDEAPPLVFVRAKRKAQGWIAEKVEIPAALIASGAVKVSEVHEWDLWPMAEKRILTLAQASEKAIKR